MAFPKIKKIVHKIPIHKITHNKKVLKTGLVIGCSLVFLGILIFAFNFAYRSRIFPQTYVGGVNIGGKSKIQAEAILRSAIGSSSQSEVTLNYSDQKWVITAEDMKVDYSIPETVDAAWSIGRQGSFGQIVKEQLKAIFGGNKRSIAFNYNESILNQKIIDISSKTDHQEKDATIVMRELKPEVQEEEEGQKLDYLETRNEVLLAFGNLKKKPAIDLPVKKVLPKVYAASAQETAKEVQSIVASPIKLKSEKADYTLEPKDYASWLRFAAVPQKDETSKIDLKTVTKDNNQTWTLAILVDHNAINNYIDSIAGEINQEPKNAKFEVRDGQVAAFQLSQTGYELDKEKSAQSISMSVLGTGKNLELPVKVIQPEITSNSAASLGIRELIGEGESSWRGSPQNRIHNLTLGTEKISGTIVKPGEEFSTISTLRPIDASAGWLPELVIKNGTQVVPDYGGGLCQVSTTLFRAALNSGLEITDRTPHSFRVSYYEPPVGMDATIYDPAPDFKFRNNTDSSILIWGVAGNNSIKFQIYGTKDGRKVEISDPWVGDYVSPGAPVYTESSSMEPGAIRQVERALQGCTASFTYKVTSVSGKVLQQETFVSKYVALSNSYLVGPGYQTPQPDTPPGG